MSSRRTVAIVAAGALLGLAVGVPPATAAPDPGSPVKVNQVAYVPGLPKQATVVSPAGAPIGWTLRNGAGATVASGQTAVKGADALSGDNVHVVDFSAYDTPGSGYVLSAGGSDSYPFDISAAPVKQLRYDSLAFFYHQRSGIAIESQYVGSRYARPAGHVGVAPNQGDTSVPCRTSCGYSLDVRGGWYDAGDQGKYVVNGGIAAWQLLNLYERSTDRAALGDGTLAIPERANGVPDVLDEARWEVEFLLRMQVPDGRTDAGMVHHKIHDENWTGLPMRPEADPQRRLLSPVSTAATLNVAAVAAQAARIWRTIDPAFSARALTAAQKAYAAAKANPSRLASGSDSTGGGAYDDAVVTDEFYWAAAELYTTTGTASYRADVTGSALYKGAGFNQRGYDWGWVAGLGDTTLALVPNDLPAADVAATRAKFASFADGLLSQMAGQGYPAPNGGTTYNWGSDGQIANNAAVLGLAHDFTGLAKYRTGAFQALDYLLGRNPLNQSYIAGYGEKAVRNVHHRFWANQSDASLPTAPPGSLSGGPNSGLQDPVAQAQLAGCKAQKCFVDDIGAYSVNEVAVNWNSALASLASWAAEHTGTVPPQDTTAPSVPGTPAASDVAATTLRLTWAASTDAESGVTGYEVRRVSGGTSTVVATPTTASAALSGLTAATAYTFTVAARNGAGLTSAASAPVTVTTAAPPADNPPSAPGTPVASAVTATGLTLTWPAATDDRGVAGYEVVRQQGDALSIVASSTGPSITLTGLTPATDYVLMVRAKDTAGQFSGFSAAATVRTPPATSGGCRVAYSTNSWGTGFSGSVTVTNGGTTAWTSWTLVFTFPGDQRVTQGWSGRWSQTGSTVTVTNETWNGAVPAGGTVSLGFNGSYTGTNANPAVFTVNGTTCT
ncbi:glycoside hydrolase family 9 protein [Dactylosporangium siamense]|uniref:Endoglucanase n=1 Tax=Dactylosporangium siamense TaxID=685454 RepID=A0A919PRQ8_9ACTN|nr:glycoside hydrolase family 9 protein [Dactylosporangium siamense]GIG48512.1 endoglucanase [Dactylosporangium siamense]